MCKRCSTSIESGASQRERLQECPLVMECEQLLRRTPRPQSGKGAMVRGKRGATQRQVDCQGRANVTRAGRMWSVAAVRVVHASTPIRRRSVGRSITDSLALVRTSSAPFCSPPSAAAASAASPLAISAFDANAQAAATPQRRRCPCSCQPASAAPRRPIGPSNTRLLTDKHNENKTSACLSAFMC